MVDSRVLGSGQYGLVVKGWLKKEDGEKLVAVKTVKATVDVENFKALLAEIKIMAYLDKQEHIVNLIGATTTKIRERKSLTAAL
jgi:serine/threonine protein kinase